MSDDEPFVAIIILNWNRYEDTLDCIESLNCLNYSNYLIIVVDNASSDASVELIKKSHYDLMLIENKVNLGFAEGNNVGIRYALSIGVEYVWILNNDTIVDSNALRALVDISITDCRIGILGSKIYYHDNPEILWFAGGPIDWKNMETPHIGKDENDCGQYDEIRDYDRVTGCSMLVSSKLCEKIGLMDSEYFLYVEEVDWCLRAWANGFRVVYVPNSKVYHKVSNSIKIIGDAHNIVLYYKIRNLLYLSKKHFSLHKSYVYMIRLIVKQVILSKHNIKNLKPIFYAVYDYCIGRMGKLNRVL